MSDLPTVEQTFSVFQDFGATTKSPSPLPSPKGRGSLLSPLSLWERGGGEGTNLEILILVCLDIVEIK